MGCLSWDLSVGEGGRCLGGWRQAAAEPEIADLLAAFNTHLLDVHSVAPWSVRALRERLANHTELRDVHGLTLGSHPRTRRSIVRGIRRRMPMDTVQIPVPTDDATPGTAA